MFKNYFKIAIRNMMRNKTFSFINILGLGLGIACSLFIYLWMQDERSYDNFHANSNRLYQVIVSDKDKTGAISNSNDNTPGLLAAALAKQYGLLVAAGHGLTYRNVSAVAAIAEVTEFNIGHHIIARSIFIGLERAVTEMREAIEAGVDG